MLIVSQNAPGQHSAVPLLKCDEAIRFIAEGLKPIDCRYLEVPVGKLIRAGGFWLVPGVRLHSAARFFLVSRDLSTPILSDQRAPGVKVYFSERAATFYIGTVAECEADRQMLTPLIKDLHPPLPTEQLVFIGHVVAAI